ncbi:unnamed protein product [Linum tenue]|uniref:Uncharacterized protein n=1 Tax=Linum tenue TaxID=586396 RepID=A0AAV0MNY1_9ROSI|nr:unnamed protein product [Linum tenue]
MGRRDPSPPKQDAPLARNVRHRRGSRLGLRQGGVQAPRRLRQAEFPQPPPPGVPRRGQVRRVQAPPFLRRRQARSDLPELGGERRERREEEEETLDGGNCKEGCCCGCQSRSGGEGGEGVPRCDGKRWVRRIIVTSIRSDVSGVRRGAVGS